MRLQRVLTDNFRAFEHAELRLPDDGLVLVAGANNSGKSALLSAFDVVAGDSGDTTALGHAGGGVPPQVTAAFALEDRERVAVLAKVATRDELLADGAVETLEFLFGKMQNQSAQPGLVLTEIRGEWPSHGMIPLIRTRVENGRAILEVLAPLAGDPAGAPSMSRLDTGGRVVTSLEDVQPIYPDVDSMRQLLISWRSRFFHFRALRTGTQRTQNSVSAERLEPTGGNLASVLLYLATDRPDMFRQLGDLVSEIVPDIGRLNVRTLGLLRVVFEDSAGDLNLKDLGTGVEQLLMTDGAMLETCGSAGKGEEKGVYLPGDLVEVSSKIGGATPVGKVQPDAHRSR